MCSQVQKNDKKSLDDQMGSLQEELIRLKEKNAEIQQVLEKEHSAFAADKKLLEDTIVDITNCGANSQAEQAAREDELRRQGTCKGEMTRAIIFDILKLSRVCRGQIRARNRRTCGVHQSR